MKKTTIIIIFSLVIIVIISAVLNIISSLQPPYVEKTDVTIDNQKIFQPISITFNKEISPVYIEQNCSIRFSPTVDFSREVKESQLIITPRPGLNGSTTYTLTVTCKDTEYSTSFVTESFESAASENWEKLQSLRDFGFASEIERVLTNEPWRAKLPIDTPLFTITYSQSFTHFIITRKENTTPEDVVRAQAQQELKKIEAPSSVEIVFR